jgi:hypothetical protein
MYARAVDDAGERLRELRQEELEDLGLAGVTLALSLAATKGAPTLALPFFIGAISPGVLGIRALWRYWDLVHRLAGDPDAYSIGEVLSYASRETTMERRGRFATLIRCHLEAPGARLDDAAEELAALADELEDESLELSPACAVVCSRLVSDPAQSTLLCDAELPLAALRSTVRRIRSGFTARCAEHA